MKLCNRILAIVLMAAILLGLYVPGAVQAEADAEPVLTQVWDFAEESDLNLWSLDEYYELVDGKLRCSFDSVANRNKTATCNSASLWESYKVSADVTVYQKPDAANKYANAALITCVNNGLSLELRLETTAGSSWFSSSATTNATLYVKTQNTENPLVNIGSKQVKKQSGYSSSSFVNSIACNLAIEINGDNVVATYTYNGKTETVYSGTLSAIKAKQDCANLAPGGLKLLTYSPQGNDEDATSLDITAEFDNVQAEVYAVNAINDTVVNNPRTYTCSFDANLSDNNNTLPEAWVEDNGVNHWTVVSDPDDDTNKIYASGGDGRTWLHVFETNVDVTASLYVPAGTNSGKVGVLVRMSGLEVPAYVKVGYDFSAGNWFVEDSKGAVADFGAPMAYKNTKYSLEPGVWHTLNVRVVDKTLTVTYNGYEVFNLPGVIQQVTTGRVGFFAEGAPFFVDDVTVQLLSGQGYVESAVLENYVLDSNGGYAEGGSIFRYDENTLVFNGYDDRFYISTDNGVTFQPVATTGDYAKYAFLNDGSRTRYIRRQDGNILRILNAGNGNYVSRLYNGNNSNDYKQSKTIYNMSLNGLVTGDGYYGGMNDYLKEINLGDIDGDGKDNYRVFYCADVRTTGVEGNGPTRLDKDGNAIYDIYYHWQEVYYTDDGINWTKAENDTRWGSAASHICESKIIPVYKDDGSLKCLRMFCTWNDTNEVRYFDSYDYGATWSQEHALPELGCGRSSYAYNIDWNAGEDDYAIYLTFLYGERDGDFYPRNRLVLIASKDGEKWDFLMDVWRWEDVPDDNLAHINQTVDPSITIDGDIIYVTAGWSEARDTKTHHNAQRQTVVRLDKTKLTVKDSFPEQLASADDITYIEVSKPTKTEYIQGEKLDLSGGYLTVHYYGGATQQIPLDDANVTITRADANHLWSTRFPAADTRTAGDHWFRVEYQNFAHGFNVYIVEKELILLDTQDPMAQVTWDLGNYATLTNNKLILEVPVEDRSTTVTMQAKDIAKWSGYTVTADLTIKPQYIDESTGQYTYSNTALCLADNKLQVRIENLGTSSCDLGIYDGQTWIDKKVAAKDFTFTLQEPNADKSLNLMVSAQFVNGKMLVRVNDSQTVEFNISSVNIPHGGKMGLFVYRNSADGEKVSVILNSLRVTAPSARNFYDANLLDKIGFNIHMSVADALKQEGTTVLKFLQNGELRSEIPLEDAVVNGEDYAFSIYLAAKEMTDTITAQLCWNGQLVAEHTYSVAEYADYIIKTNSPDYTQKYKDIAQAMLNYGAAAQEHFKYNAGNLADGVFADGWNADIDVSKLAGYKPFASGTLPAGVQFYGTSMVMENRNIIRHYFRMDDATAAKVAVTLWGEELELQKSGQFYYVDVAGVDVANLDYAYTVTISDGEKSFSITYSALSYVYQVLNTASYSGTSMEKLAQALYLFHLSVHTDIETGDDEFEILPI